MRFGLILHQDLVQFHIKFISSNSLVHIRRFELSIMDNILLVLHLRTPISILHNFLQQPWTISSWMPFINIVCCLGYKTWVLFLCKARERMWVHLFHALILKGSSGFYHHLEDFYYLIKVWFNIYLKDKTWSRVYIEGMFHFVIHCTSHYLGSLVQRIQGELDMLFQFSTCREIKVRQFITLQVKFAHPIHYIT